MEALDGFQWCGGCKTNIGALQQHNSCQVCVGLSNTLQGLLPIRSPIVDTLEQVQVPVTNKLMMSCKIFGGLSALVSCFARVSVHTVFICWWMVGVKWTDWWQSETGMVQRLWYQFSDPESKAIWGRGDVMMLHRWCHLEGGQTGNGQTGNLGSRESVSRGDLGHTGPPKQIQRVLAHKWTVNTAQSQTQWRSKWHHLLHALTVQRDPPQSRGPPQELPHCATEEAVFLLAAGQQPSFKGMKHFAIKFHQFWQCVHHKEKNPNSWLQTGKMSTNLMDATGCLTKGLAHVKLDANHKRAQWWWLTSTHSFTHTHAHAHASRAAATDDVWWRGELQEAYLTKVWLTWQIICQRVECGAWSSTIVTHCLTLLCQSCFVWQVLISIQVVFNQISCSLCLSRC